MWCYRENAENRVDGQNDKRRSAKKMRSRKTGTIGRDHGNKEAIYSGKEDGTIVQFRAVWKNRRKGYEKKNNVNADGRLIDITLYILYILSQKYYVCIERLPPMGEAHNKLEIGKYFRNKCRSRLEILVK